MSLFLALVVFLQVPLISNDAQKANNAYEQGDYEQAAELYRQSIEADPENPRLYFNLGNSLANLSSENAQQAAIEAYEQFKSLTDDPLDHSLADYNIGNLLSDEEPQRAAEFYKQALGKNPDDEDARYNYELALRQHEEEQQQEQPQQDQSEQEEDQNEDQEQQDDSQQDQNQQPPQDSQQDPQQSPQGEDEENPPMSEEEAESILDALEQQERELLKNREKDARDESSNNDKDW